MSDTKSDVWQFYQDGEWRTGMNQHGHRKNTEDAGLQTRDLYVVPEGFTIIEKSKIEELEADISFLESEFIEAGQRLAMWKDDYSRRKGEMKVHGMNFKMGDDS